MTFKCASQMIEFVIRICIHLSSGSSSSSKTIGLARMILAIGSFLAHYGEDRPASYALNLWSLATLAFLFIAGKTITMSSFPACQFWYLRVWMFESLREWVWKKKLCEKIFCSFGMCILAKIEWCEVSKVCQTKWRRQLKVCAWQSEFRRVSWVPRYT